MWMDRHCLNGNMRKAIKESIKKRWENVRDADIENLFYILPAKSQKSLKHFLCMDMLKKVTRSLSIYIPLENLSKFDFYKLMCFFFYCDRLHNYMSMYV